MKFQRGGFVMGLIVGLLVGLAAALAVALYVTKAPNPFIDKVPQRTAAQDAAEIERNKNWDPNAPLAGKPVRPAAAAAASAPSAMPPQAQPNDPTATVIPAGKDPAAILSGQDGAPANSTLKSTAASPEPFNYFVQAGAFTRAEDAEQQRARLAMLGTTARVSEREQAGRTVYRVRLGPFEKKEEADAAQDRLLSSGIESVLVRVER